MLYHDGCTGDVLTPNHASYISATICSWVAFIFEGISASELFLIKSVLWADSSAVVYSYQ